MLEQTKQSIKAMKAAGFKRSQFSAKTERITFTYRELADFVDGEPIYRKGKMTEYGNCIITPWVTKFQALRRVRAALAAGLDVSIFVFEDGKVSYPHFSLATGSVGKLERIEVQ